jgi:hypothetical protein
MIDVRLVDSGWSRSDTLALVALLVSMVAVGAPWLINWIQRPKITLFLRKCHITDKGLGIEEDMVQVLVANDGYRPLIISQCKSTTKDGGQCELGIYDEFYAPYGVTKIAFPMVVGPGDVKFINFNTAGCFESFETITLLDSQDRKYPVPEKEITKLKERVLRKS